MVTNPNVPELIAVFGPPNIGVFNALNANTILGINTAFGSAWRRPTSVLAGRTVEFGGQLSF